MMAKMVPIMKCKIVPIIFAVPSFAVNMVPSKPMMSILGMPMAGATYIKMVMTRVPTRKVFSHNEAGYRLPTSL